MIKKIICLGMVLIMIVGFTACNKNEEEAGVPLNFNVSYNQRHSIDELSKNSLNKKVDSVEMLVNISNESNYPFFKEIKYFILQKNTIILVFYNETIGDDPAKIDSIYLEEDILKVTIARPEAKAANAVVSIYAFLIEVDKKDVESANKVESMQIRKGQIEDYL